MSLQSLFMWLEIHDYETASDLGSWRFPALVEKYDC